MSIEVDQANDFDGASEEEITKIEMQRRLLAKTKTDKTNTLLKKSNFQQYSIL